MNPQSPGFQNSGSKMMAEDTPSRLDAEHVKALPQRPTPSATCALSDQSSATTRANEGSKPNQSTTSVNGNSALLHGSPLNYPHVLPDNDLHYASTASYSAEAQYAPQKWNQANQYDEKPPGQVHGKTSISHQSGMRREYGRYELFLFEDKESRGTMRNGASTEVC